jgi:hypothetical protein
VCAFPIFEEIFAAIGKKINNDKYVKNKKVITSNNELFNVKIKIAKNIFIIDKPNERNAIII